MCVSMCEDIQIQNVPGHPLLNSCSYLHYIDVIMTTMASQITSLAVVYITIYSDADQRKHQSSASLAFVWEFTGAGEFPAQRASYVENVSIWWRHHGERVTLGTNKPCNHRLIPPWTNVAAICQMMTPNGFSWIDELTVNSEFWWNFHWTISHKILKIISYHWFR